MTMLAPELTMMLLGSRALQCFTVLMAVGENAEIIHYFISNKWHFFFFLPTLKFPLSCNVVTNILSYNNMLYLIKCIWQNISNWWLFFSFLFRLFSCGTSKEGDSYLVEWNESEGAIKRTYAGFRKKSAGVVQFDTTQNHLLAAGEDHQIKFWDMDNVNVLTSIDADGGLPVSIAWLNFLFFYEICSWLNQEFTSLY